MSFDFVAHGREQARRNAEQRAGWPKVPLCPLEQDRRFQRALAAHFAGVKVDLSFTNAAPADPIEMVSVTTVIAMPSSRWRRIVEQVAASHRVRVSDIMGQTRAKKVSAARFEVYWRMKEELGFSLTAIGHRIGERDHTSVLHGIKQHAKRLGEVAA